jgi:hypothetical protein
MLRALAQLPPEDHRSIEKRSCKRMHSKGRPKYQNVRVSLLSAAFFLYSVLALRRAMHCRLGNFHSSLRSTEKAERSSRTKLNGDGIDAPSALFGRNNFSNVLDVLLDFVNLRMHVSD